MKKRIILLAGITILFSAYAQSQSCNVIVSSTKFFENAQKIQKDYTKKFDNVNIVKNNSGWFMVSVAEIDKKMVTKIVRKWKKMKKIPKDSLYSCKTYHKVTTQNLSPRSESVTSKKEQATPVVDKSPVIVNQINQAYYSYERIKLLFVTFYEHTIKLQKNMSSLTKKEKQEYAKKVQVLKKEETLLIQSFNKVASVYDHNSKILEKAKNANTILPYLQQERAFILDFLEKIKTL